MGLSDSLFMWEGSILNTPTSMSYTLFWYLDTLSVGWCRFACCLVSMWYISELTKSWFLFLIINRRRERIYWEGRGKISNLRNNFLHESLALQPIMSLIIFFLQPENLYTFIHLDVHFLVFMSCLRLCRKELD